MSKEDKLLINFVNYTKDGKYQEGDITVINDRLYTYVNGTFELMNDARFSDMPYLLIDKLQNNWNELKEWLEEVVGYEEYDKIEKDTFQKILSKMQEIEGKSE